MDLGWLEDYLALRELGSFTAAAERRNLSQPAFSRRIQALEAWLGVTLVDRSVRPHRFTSVALENDGDLHDFLNRLYDLRSRLRGEQTRACRLSVAVQHALAISLFPRLVEALRGKGFQPAYHLHCADRQECIDMMLRREVDLLICHEVGRHSAMVPTDIAARLVVGRDAMLLVGPPSITPEDGGRLPLLTYPQAGFFGQVVWEQGMPQLTRRFEVETVCISAFSGALCQMVLAGLGFAWLPRSLVGEDLRNGRLAALDPDGLNRPLEVVAYLHHQSEAASEAALSRHMARIDFARLME
ncbi:MAG TPA: LysR substrate-binding domain-containing protein [Stellaceae bacterium]|jgi:DNA-binding transcriptional LysR family regulator|nr:LysR substrate-binding domain-containing protein [Stellaceae bacterium]